MCSFAAFVIVLRSASNASVDTIATASDQKERDASVEDVFASIIKTIIKCELSFTVEKVLNLRFDYWPAMRSERFPAISGENRRFRHKTDHRLASLVLS